MHEVKAAEMNLIFGKNFGQPLIHEGFVRVSDRKWIRRHSADIADLFEIQALKGANYSPLWGFSLSYVPHISGSTLRWHNTDKSAQFDYRYDPLDSDYRSRDEYEAWLISRLWGVERAQQEAEYSSNRSLPLALALFSEISNIDKLIHLYADSLQAYRAKVPRRFGFFNYTQFPIAYALTLSRLGKYDEGVAILQEAQSYGLEYGSAFEKLLARMKEFAAA